MRLVSVSSNYRNLTRNLYPTSTGTHWLWDMLYQIYTRKIGPVDFHKSKYMLEAISGEEFESLTSPRVVNSHIPFSHLPEDFKDKRCKIIYVLRNPKDVAVSFYHHHCNFSNYRGSWANHLSMYLQGKSTLSHFCLIRTKKEKNISNIMQTFSSLFSL